MHIFVWVMRGTEVWANRVSSDARPETTERPINATAPQRRCCRFAELIGAAHEIAIIGHVNVWHLLGHACLECRKRHAPKRTGCDDQ